MDERKQAKEEAIKLIDKLMNKLNIYVWELDAFTEHECERCDCG